MTFEQRIVLKELSESTENKVYSYDKGIGFVILNNKDAIQKIEEQIGESAVPNTNPTSALTSKIQKHLVTLCKQQKSLKLELISNSIFPILFHHVFMESQKPINLKNVIPCEL